MGGKGGDQITGYQYFTNLVVMIGNRIEELKAINFDKRGWIVNDEQKLDPRFKMEDDATYNFTYPDIYGKDEGGVVGAIGLRLGKPSPESDPAYAAYLQSKDFPALAYPYLSYLVFKGKNQDAFYVGNNPFLKEMMLWPKRTRTRNDGRVQWFDSYVDPENPFRIIHVAEIGAYKEEGVTELPVGEYVIPGWQFTRTITFSENRDAPYQSFSESGFGLPFAVLSNSYHYYYDISNGSMKNDEILYQPSSAYSSFLQSNLNLEGASAIPPLTWKYPDPNENVDFWDFDPRWNPQDSVRTIEYVADFEYPFSFTTKLIFGGKHIYFYLEFKNLNGGWQTILGRDFSNKEENGSHIFNVEANTQYRARVICANRYLGGPPLFALKWSVNDAQIEVKGIDINPIHKIREILTDETAMNISELEINDEIFRRAAVQIWNEDLGISCAFTEKNCKEALDEICSHIEAGVRVNRKTGKYEVILFRDNWYDLGNALHFDQSNIKRGSFGVEVMNTDDAINVLNVNYYDRDNIKDSSFNVYENGLIQTMGRENAETVDFPYFMNQRNAEVVANWKLKQLSTPAWRGSFSTSHRAARRLNRFDIITVTWPSKQIYDMPMRVMKINLGTATDTAVTIDFVEVVPYSNELISSIVVDSPVSVVLPPQPTNPTAFEVPYYALVQSLGQREADAQLTYNTELGYLGVSAQKPQSNSLNALLYTDGGTGDYLQFQKVGVVDYSSGVYLDQAISPLDTAFAVTDLDYVRNGSPKFSGVAVGTIGQIANELVAFVEYDSETKILTVKRGVLDSVPTKHISGLIHFWGESFAYDSNEYVMGETVAAQVLTTTPSGVDLLHPGAVKEVEMNSRAIRPYPPANVKLNESYYPESLIISNDIVLSWVDRNRMQQTGGEVLSYFDAGVIVEDGVTYAYELSSENVVLDSLSSIAANTATILASMLIQNKPHTLKLWSNRDGYDSYQIFEHSFFVEAVSLILTATTSGDAVTGSTDAEANIYVDVDESLAANIYFDGSKIIGKAEPGATIIIEIEE